MMRTSSTTDSTATITRTAVVNSMREGGVHPEHYRPRAMLRPVIRATKPVGEAGLSGGWTAETSTADPPDRLDRRS